MPPLSSSDIAALLRQPGPLQLSGQDLTGAQLQGFDLSGANLTGAILRRANLRNAILRGAQLSGADIEDADLSQATLDNADLSQANLRWSTLSFASLVQADLTGATLNNTINVSANLRDAVLRRANLSGANLRQANFSGADLTDAIMNGADVRDSIGILPEDPNAALGGRSGSGGPFSPTIPLGGRAPAGSGVPFGPPVPVGGAVPSQPGPTANRSSVGCGLIALVALGLILVIGGAGALLLSQNGIGWERVSRSFSPGATASPRAGRGSAAATTVAGTARPLPTSPPPTSPPFEAGLIGTRLIAATINDDQQTDLLGVSRADDGSVVALSGADGSVLWHTALPGQETISIALQAGDLVIAVRDTSLFGLSAADGSEIWRSALPDKLINGARVYGFADVVVAHTIDNTLTAFERTSGKQLWQEVLASPNQARSGAISGQVCVSSKGDERTSLECFVAESGASGASYDLGAWFDETSWWTTADHTAVYRFVDDNSRPVLSKLNGGDGATLWRQWLDPAFSEAFFDDDVRLVDDGDRVALSINNHLSIIANGGQPVEVIPEARYLYAFGFNGPLLYSLQVKQRGTATVSLIGVDAETGEVRWQQGPFGDDASEVRGKVTEQGMVLAWRETITADTINMALINAAGEEVWRRNAEFVRGTELQLLAMDDRLLVGGNGVAAAYDLKTGAPIWRIR